MRAVSMQILHRLTNESLRRDRPAGKFRMTEIEPRIENSDLDPIAVTGTLRNLARYQSPGRSCHLNFLFWNEQRFFRNTEILRNHLSGMQNASHVVGSVNVAGENEVFRVNGVKWIIRCDRRLCSQGVGFCCRAAEQSGMDLGKHHGISVADFFQDDSLIFEILGMGKPHAALRFKMFDCALGSAFLECHKKASGFRSVSTSL